MLLLSSSLSFSQRSSWVGGSFFIVLGNFFNNFTWDSLHSKVSLSTVDFIDRGHIFFLMPKGKQDITSTSPASSSYYSLVSSPLLLNPPCWKHFITVSHKLHPKHGFTTDGQNRHVEMYSMKCKTWMSYRKFATCKLTRFCQFHTNATNCRRWPTSEVSL